MRQGTKMDDSKRIATTTSHDVALDANSVNTDSIFVDRVSKAYVTSAKSEPTIALEDVTLSIPSGRFVALLGPSGCGKSTILNLVAGLESATTGDVYVDGNSVKGVNSSLAYIPQNDNLFPWRTVLSNIEFALEVRGVKVEERRARSREMIESVGLKGFENHFPSQLSGGMRKRVSIVRSLVYESDVWLLDEPFGPLDAQTRLVLQNDLLGLWRTRSPAVLFITHDIVEAIALADEVIVMTARPGRIKSIYQVGIPRPRNVFDIYEAPGFNTLYEAILSDIKSQLGAP